MRYFPERPANAPSSALGAGGFVRTETSAGGSAWGVPTMIYAEVRRTPYVLRKIKDGNYAKFGHLATNYADIHKMVFPTNYGK